MMSEVSLHARLLEHVQRQPDRVAFRFVLDPRDLSRPESWAVLSFAELDAAARVVAARLEAFAPGSRIVLAHPPGPDYIASFFGCLYARQVAVPTILPSSPAAIERLAGIVSDARPAAFLTTAAFLAACEDVVEIQAPGLTGIATDELAPQHWSGPQQVSGDALAFLQYTSGSTRAPRGVRVTHRNLVANIDAIERHVGLGPEDRQVSWLPPYHDMGLIVGILQPIYTGSEAILMSPFAFLLDPLCWLETLSHVRGTFSGAPNFAFDLCVRRASPERLAALDLSSWRVAFSGAEPIRPASMRAFAQRFAAAGFDPRSLMAGYGLAEATLAVAARPVGSGLLCARPVQAYGAGGEGSSDVVSVGPPFHATCVRIVDPEKLTPCEPGAVGEIWVQSASVSAGYWDAESGTDPSFLATIPGEEAAGAFLRTGDLGFVLGSELYVSGRLKDLVILKGQNHYPQDIEETVWSSSPALRAGCAAAFGSDVDGRECLVVVQECAAEPTEEQAREIAASARRQVQRMHGAALERLVLIEKKTIPKTSAGKIRRKATKQALESGQLKVLHDLAELAPVDS